MSRIGNRKLVSPEGVTIVEENNVVTVKGPKGELTTNLAANISIKVEGNTLEVLRSNDNNNTKTMHGTINALINNMMTGVTKGFEKKLESVGVGYRFQLKGAELVVTAGYSHPVNVKIPAGTKSGQVLRLKGQGYANAFGRNYGDALVTINVRPHKYFRLDGNDVVVDLPITIKEAVLGAKVVVPTIDGRVNVTIPAYSSSGEKLRLRGKGVKSKNGLGDEIVNLVIVSPKNKIENLENVLKMVDDENVRSF